MDVEIERKKIVYNYRIDLIKVIALFLVVLYHSSLINIIEDTNIKLHTTIRIRTFFNFIR